MVWRVPYPTGGPPVPTLFWALALLVLEGWFGSILVVSLSLELATQSKGLGRLQVQPEGQVGLVEDVGVARHVGSRGTWGSRGSRGTM